MNESIPVLVALLQGFGIAYHDKTALRARQGDVHPPPVGEESDPSLTVRPNCGEYDQVSFSSLVGTGVQSAEHRYVVRQINSVN